MYVTTAGDAMQTPFGVKKASHIKQIYICMYVVEQFHIAKSGKITIKSTTIKYFMHLICPHPFTHSSIRIEGKNQGNKSNALPTA